MTQEKPAGVLESQYYPMQTPALLFGTDPNSSPKIVGKFTVHDIPQIRTIIFSKIKEHPRNSTDC